MGRFEVSWNDGGEQRAVWNRSTPFPCRRRLPRFRNVGDGEGILQVIITGGGA